MQVNSRDALKAHTVVTNARFRLPKVSSLAHTTVNFDTINSHLQSTAILTANRAAVEASLSSTSTSTKSCNLVGGEFAELRWSHVAIQLRAIAIKHQNTS